jgi:hypothetical protein
MRNQKKDLRNCVVYNDLELNTMRKYLKDIAKVSNAGNYPKYEIGKLASMLNVGGETYEHYSGDVE